MINIIAHFFLKEENLEKAFSAAKELADETRKEKGCNKYNFYQDASNKSHLIFMEEWETQADLDSHCETRHFKALVPRIEELREKDGFVEFFNKIV